MEEVKKSKEMDMLNGGLAGKLRGSGWYFCKPSGFSPAARFW